MTDQNQYYDLPKFFEGALSSEEYEKTICGETLAEKEYSRSSYRGLQLIKPVMDAIEKGGGVDENGHLLNILLCDIPEALEKMGIRLINPTDLVYCLIRLEMKKMIEIGNFCYHPEKQQISTFVHPLKKAEDYCPWD